MNDKILDEELVTKAETNTSDLALFTASLISNGFGVVAFFLAPSVFSLIILAFAAFFVNMSNVSSLKKWIGSIPFLLILIYVGLNFVIEVRI